MDILDHCQPSAVGGRPKTGPSPLTDDLTQAVSLGVDPSTLINILKLISFRLQSWPFNMMVA